MFYTGSSALTAHPHQECVFLIQQIGVGYPKYAAWFRSNAAWKALDEAVKEFGNCKIVKSALASEYDVFCKANQE